MRYTALIRIKSAMLAALLVLIGACTGLPVGPQCVADNEQDALYASTLSSCSEIEITGDEFLDLQSLEALDHPASITVRGASKLVSTFGLPLFQGRLQVISAPQLEEIESKGSDGLFLQDALNTAKVKMFLGQENSEEPGRRPVLLSSTTFSSLDLECGVAECDVAVSLYRQVGPLAVAFDENSRMRIGFERADSAAVRGVMSFDLGRIDEIGFRSMPAETYPDLRLVRDFLLEQEFAGSVGFPGDLD